MKQRPSKKGDEGVSPAIATLLLIALTLILCAIIAACCMSFISLLEQPLNKSPPEILAIQSVNHCNAKGEKTYASIVNLKNIGKQSLKNSDYSADVYVNDIKQYIIIKTLNAHDFISTNHFGIRLLYGTGTTGYWEPNQSGFFDLNDRTIHPGDLLQIDIIDNNESSPSFSKVISRSTKLID